MCEQAGDDVSGEKQNEAGSKVPSLSTAGTTAGIAAKAGSCDRKYSSGDRVLSTLGTWRLGCKLRS